MRRQSHPELFEINANFNSVSIMLLGISLRYMLESLQWFANHINNWSWDLSKISNNLDAFI